VVLEDQRAYYKQKIERNKLASSQVNRARAFFAFMAGVASLLAAILGGLIAAQQGFGACDVTQQLDAIAALNLPQAQADELEMAMGIGADTNYETSAFNCGLLRTFASVLMIVAVGAPAVGAAFTTLADLYQWERLTSIYETALKSLAVSDALSPLPEEPDPVYHASLNAFVEGTLSVMRDETSQWGQLVKMPDALQEYIEKAKERAESAGRNDDSGGSAGGAAGD
jgi:hypothetical protein